MRTQADWNSFYSTPNPWHNDGTLYDQVRCDALLHRIRYAKFASAIDFGCGEGHLTAQLSPYAKSLIGCDISDIALGRARKRYPGIDFRQGDLLDLLVRPEIQAEHFDFVSVSDTLYYLQTDAERKMAVHGLAQLGTANCLFYVSVIINSTSKHRRYFTHEEMLALVAPYFQVIETFPVYAEESLLHRIAQRCLPTAQQRFRLARAVTQTTPLSKCKHAGYFLLKLAR